MSNVLRVNASNGYDIIFEKGIINEVGASVKKALDCAEKLLVISDANVFSIYGENVVKSLKKSGFIVEKYIIDAGEQSKNIISYINGIKALSVGNYTRRDGVIALGGGVVGDLAGFISGTYLRGIRFVQIPTTLLAMLDSSVGGKTAVDLPEGKNLLGVFHNPSLVISDVSCLKTLPEREMISGLGEAVKCGILSGGRLFELLENGNFDENIEEIIYLSVNYKRQIVEKDERESGLRKLLNLGHTFGHAYEVLSNFSRSHGECVGSGLFDSLKVSEHLKIIEEESYLKIKNLLGKLGYHPDNDYDYEEIKKVILHDKKGVGNGKIDFIAISKVGDCKIVPIDIDALRSTNIS